MSYDERINHHHVLALSCNSCCLRLDGTTYRSIACFHIFCSDCAVKHFTNARACPVCNARLNEGDVLETMVGVGGASLEEATYSFGLKDNSWAAIIENTSKIQTTALQLSGLCSPIFKQLIY